MFTRKGQMLGSVPAEEPKSERPKTKAAKAAPAAEAAAPTESKDSVKTALRSVPKSEDKK